jgi:hypothetical protein
MPRKSPKAEKAKSPESLSAARAERQRQMPGTMSNNISHEKAQDHLNELYQLLAAKNFDAKRVREIGGEMYFYALKYNLPAQFFKLLLAAFHPPKTILRAWRENWVQSDILRARDFIEQQIHLPLWKGQTATGEAESGGGTGDAPKLSRKAAKVWKYLEKFREKNSCDPTYDDITANPPDGLKMGRQTVSQAYKELRAAGFSVPGKTKKN